MTLAEMKKLDYEAGLHYELTHYAVFLSPRAKDQTVRELKDHIDSLFPLDIKAREDALLAKDGYLGY